MSLAAERAYGRDGLPFDLGVFDLDGTVLWLDLTITAATVSAMRRLRERGLRLLVATGRRFESAAEHAERLEFSGEDPIICYGGSMIRRMDGETLLHRTVPKELSVEALEWARERGLHARLFTDDAIVTSKAPPDGFEHRASPGEPRVTEMDDPADWLRGGGEQPTKIVFVDHPEGVERWLEAAREAFWGRLFVTRSLPHYVEVSSLEGTKSNALRWLCEQWGIDPTRTIAFGDADNDIDMLRFVGRGIAVGGMSPEVREAADAVVPPVDEDGVALYIEKLLEGKA